VFIVSELRKFKLIIFGDSGVGKTTLTRRFVTNTFIEDLRKTIGTDISKKTLEVEGMAVSLLIWDFGGEERYQVLFPSFIKGANGGIFMYDITRDETLKNFENWLSFFKDEQKILKIPIIIVGGKSDLENLRLVNMEDAIDIAQLHNLDGYYECSSKTGMKVETIFQAITKLMLKKLD